MSESDRERRFQEAVAKLKWWSEIVGIFGSWALLIGVTFVSVRIIERIPPAGDPNFKPVLAIANLATFIVIFSFFVIYTVRTAWLIYCWVSKTHNDNGGWFSRYSDYLATAVLVSLLAIGMLSIAMTVANMQLSFN